LASFGYPIQLDLLNAGRPFEIERSGLRRRSEPSQPPLPSSVFSADAALRPLLADSLFPSIGNVLGPSEIAYHALLKPLYKHWEIGQPLAIPRSAATLIPENGLDQLTRFGIPVTELLNPSFKPADAAKSLAGETVATAFIDANTRLEESLLPLKDMLNQIDPGLETRWKQTLDQAKRQLNRLEERAVRAHLARKGLSVKALQFLKEFLLPMEKPQERILSGYSIVAKYGVEWIDRMLHSGEPSRFEHQLIVLKEPHD